MKRSNSMMALAGLFVTLGQVNADILEDFEAETVGSFPSAWLDVGQIDPGQGVPNPSALVVNTTDAFGNPTKALSLIDFAGSPQGIYQSIGQKPQIRISADMRIDQLSNPTDNHVSDWAMQFSFVALDGSTFDFAPQMGLFASSHTQTWGSYTDGTNGLSHITDYGTAFNLGDWLSVTVELDSIAGTIRSEVVDAATGTLLLDQFESIPGWDPSQGAFDGVAFFDGELAQGATIGNITLLDNIVVQTIPEPANLSMCLLGLAAWLGHRRKK